MKNLALTVLLLALGCAGLAGNALANCVVVGTVVATDMDDDVTGAEFNMVFVRKRALADHIFSFTTRDQDIMLVAAIAKSSQMEVKITGNAASCPGSGSERDGGQVLQLGINS